MIVYLKKLIQHSVTRSFPSRSVILHDNQVPKTAYIVLRGIVRVYSISPKGEEQIIAFHTAGELFPSAWIFNKSRSSQFFYEALTTCDIAYIDRGKLLTFFLSNQDRSNALIDYLTTNYAASLLQLSALGQPNAHEKIIHMLYFLCQRHGTLKKHGKSIEIPLQLTHQNFASLIGLTRETTAIEMNKLKKQKIITYRKQRYTVDSSKLINLINEEGLRNVSIAINNSISNS